MKYGTPKMTMDHLSEIKGTDYVPSSTTHSISTSKSLGSENVKTLLNHPSHTIARAAYENKDMNPDDAKKSIHPEIANKALSQHGTKEELDSLVKSSSIKNRTMALSSKNTSKDHINAVVKKLEPYHADKNDRTNDDYDSHYRALGQAMIEHDHVPDLPKFDHKPRIYVPDHNQIAKMSRKNYSRLKKNFDLHMPDVSDSNVTDILVSHPEHINDAFSGEHSYIHRYTGGHHLIANSLHLTDETLRKVGTEAAGSKDEMGHTLSISLARHPNASPETKKAIATSAHDSHRFKSQLNRIAERN